MDGSLPGSTTTVTDKGALFQVRSPAPRWLLGPVPLQMRFHSMNRRNRSLIMSIYKAISFHSGFASRYLRPRPLLLNMIPKRGNQAPSQLSRFFKAFSQLPAGSAGSRSI